MASTAYYASADADIRKAAGVSDALLTLGRIFIAVMFVMSGIEKFLGIDQTAQMIASKNLPMPMVAAFATAALELGGGVLIVLGWQTRMAALALAAFTAVATYFFHDFWNMPPGAEHTNNMIHAMKNLSVIGGFLMLAAVGAGRYSIDGPRIVHDKRPAKIG